MAEDVATTSSRPPPFGLSVVVVTEVLASKIVLLVREFRRQRRAPWLVDDADDRAVDAELPDVFDHLERAKARRDRLRHVVPDDGKAVDHDRDHHAEPDAFADRGALPFVAFRIRERHREE